MSYNAQAPNQKQCSQVEQTLVPSSEQTSGSAVPTHASTLDQTARSSDSRPKSDQAPDPSHILIFRGMNENRRRILKAIIENEPMCGEYITSKAEIASWTGIPGITIRRNLQALADLKFLKKETYRRKGLQGIRIWLSHSMCKGFSIWLNTEQTTDQTKGDVASAPPSDNTILDRQTKSLSLSVKEMLAKLNDEDIAQTWPEFFSLGFTHSKFQELIR